MDSRKTGETSVLKDITFSSFDDNSNISTFFISEINFIRPEKFPSPFPVAQSSNLVGSSSRRKAYSQTRGSTLHEFIRSNFEDSTPTVVDRLISKNRFALLQSQMKKQKQKPNHNSSNSGSASDSTKKPRRAPSVVNDKKSLTNDKKTLEKSKSHKNHTNENKNKNITKRVDTGNSKKHKITRQGKNVTPSMSKSSKLKISTENKRRSVKKENPDKPNITKYQTRAGVRRVLRSSRGNILVKTKRRNLLIKRRKKNIDKKTNERQVKRNEETSKSTSNNIDKKTNQNTNSASQKRKMKASGEIEIPAEKTSCSQSKKKKVHITNKAATPSHKRSSVHSIVEAKENSFPQISDSKHGTKIKEIQVSKAKIGNVSESSGTLSKLSTLDTGAKNKENSTPEASDIKTEVTNKILDVGTKQSLSNTKSKENSTPQASEKIADNESKTTNASSNSLPNSSAKSKDGTLQASDQKEIDITSKNANVTNTNSLSNSSVNSEENRTSQASDTKTTEITKNNTQSKQTEFISKLSLSKFSADSGENRISRDPETVDIAIKIPYVLNKQSLLNTSMKSEENRMHQVSDVKVAGITGKPSNVPSEHGLSDWNAKNKEGNVPHTSELEVEKPECKTQFSKQDELKTSTKSAENSTYQDGKQKIGNVKSDTPHFINNKTIDRTSARKRRRESASDGNKVLKRQKSFRKRAKSEPKSSDETQNANREIPSIVPLSSMSKLNITKCNVTDTQNVTVPLLQSQKPSAKDFVPIILDIRENSGVLSVPENNVDLHFELSQTSSTCVKQVDDAACLQEVYNSRHAKEDPKQNSSVIEQIPEDATVKESILNALGLQSSDKVKNENKDSNYTGTLKAVIKLHKTSDTDKGYRRMEMKQYSGEITAWSNPKEDSVITDLDDVVEDSVESLSENNTSIDAWLTDYDTTVGGYLGKYLSKNKVAHLKEKKSGSLIVPEKSACFSIHPNRLCYDVCKYCLSKFGMLDTPCHVAQLKNPERQRKILSSEPLLKVDTCLCDACFRHVNKKANRPCNKRKVILRTPMNQRAVCSVEDCSQNSRHFVRRRWLHKLRRKFPEMSLDLRRNGPRMSFGLCSHHFYMVDFHTFCGLCKRRLTGCYTYSVNSKLDCVNRALSEDGIPVRLITSTATLCKTCHYYTSLRIKLGKPSVMKKEQRQSYESFKRKIIGKCDLNVDDLTSTQETNRRQVHSVDHNETSENMSQNDGIIDISDDDDDDDEVENDQGDTRRSNASMTDQRTSYEVGFTNIADLLKPLEGDISDKIRDNNATRIQVKFGNLNIGKLSNLNIGQDSRSETKRSEETSSSSEDGELSLVANFNFDEASSSNNTNWEKCVSTIQFDKNTKKLWQDLQKPYGNQSSFMRHLVMLEKYWRSGALVLSENADSAAVKYITSVKNRVESLDMSGPKRNAENASTSRNTNQKQPVPVKVISNIPSSSSPGRAPPPLVKMSTMPDQFNVLRGPPSLYSLKPPEVKNVAPLKELTPLVPTSGPTSSTHFAQRVILNASQVKNIIPVTLQQFRELSSKRLTEGTKTGKRVNVSVLNSSSLSTNAKSKSSPTVIDSITISPEKEPGPSCSNVVIPNLPKNLTVTQVDDNNSSNSKPANEKPSISVFRETPPPPE